MPYRRQLALRKLTSRTNSRSPAPSTSSGLASPHCSVTKSPAMLTKTDCGPAAYAVATRIRPFSPKDITEVVDLHKRVFPGNPFSSSELEIHFRLLFFENPWYDADLPSLVYQEQGEKICGFYGVIPRRMRMQGRPIRAVVSSQFMVDPSVRNRLAAVELQRTFFAGPQDLSFTDGANDASRRIWEGLGGLHVGADVHSIRHNNPPRRISPGRICSRYCRGLRARNRSVPIMTSVPCAGFWNGQLRKNATEDCASHWFETALDKLLAGTCTTSIRTVSARFCSL